MATQIDSSTLVGNVEFVHSQYSCFLTSQVSTVFVSDKIIDNSDNFRLSAYLTVKYVKFYVFFIFCSYTFLFNLGKHVN